MNRLNVIGTGYRKASLKPSDETLTSGREPGRRMPSLSADCTKATSSHSSKPGRTSPRISMYSGCSYGPQLSLFDVREVCKDGAIAVTTGGFSGRCSCSRGLRPIERHYLIDNVDTANLEEITRFAPFNAITIVANTLKPSSQQLSVALSSPAENSRLGLGIDAAYPTRLLKPGEPSECLCASRKHPVLLET